MSRFGKLLTVPDAAEYSGLSHEQLYRLSREGRIACVRTDGRERKRRQNGKVVVYQKSGRLMFYERDLDAWIDEHRTPASTAIQPAARGRATTARVQHQQRDASIDAFMPKQKRFA